MGFAESSFVERGVVEAGCLQVVSWKGTPSPVAENPKLRIRFGVAQRFSSAIRLVSRAGFSR